MYRNRILKEAAQAQKQSDPSIFLFMENNNLLKWRAFLAGPEDSPYKDSYFELHINLDQDYPVKPPKIRTCTRIFHPNIHWESGEICLEALQDQWTPLWTLESLCRAILFLLSNPNPESPLNCDAGNMLRHKDNLAFQSMAKMYSIDYGISKESIHF